MWAPLMRPMGEKAIAAPMDPNRNPVISLRTPGEIGRDANGASWPHIAMTIDSPRNTSRAVPANSAAYMRGCNLSNGCGATQRAIDFGRSTVAGFLLPLHPGFHGLDS